MLRPGLSSRVALGLVGLPKIGIFTGGLNLMQCSTVGSPSPRANQGRSTELLLKFLASANRLQAHRFALCMAPHRPIKRRQSLYVGERGNEVFDDIVNVLQSAREPHHSVADTKLRACSRREPLVRCCCRVRDQTFGIAEIVADLDELE